MSRLLLSLSGLAMVLALTACSKKESEEGAKTAAPVVLACTHERTLDVVPLEVLKEHAVDVPDDLTNL